MDQRSPHYGLYQHGLRQRQYESHGHESLHHEPYKHPFTKPSIRKRKSGRYVLHTNNETLNPKRMTKKKIQSFSGGWIAMRKSALERPKGNFAIWFEGAGFETAVAHGAVHRFVYT